MAPSLAEAVREAAEASRFRQQNKDPGPQERNEVSLHAIAGSASANERIDSEIARTQPRLPPASASKWVATFTSSSSANPVYTHADTGEVQHEPPDEVLAAVRAAQQAEHEQSPSSSDDDDDDSDEAEDDADGEEGERGVFAAGWMAHMDTSTQHPYFINQHTGDWCWKVPSSLECGASELGLPNSGWRVATDAATGVPYFYCPDRKISQWTPPAPSQQKSHVGINGDKLQEEHHDDGGIGNDEEECDDNGTDVDIPHLGNSSDSLVNMHAADAEHNNGVHTEDTNNLSSKTLPSTTWTLVKDSSSGNNFYFNTRTGEKVWAHKSAGEQEGVAQQGNVHHAARQDGAQDDMVEEAGSRPGARAYRYVDANGQMQGPFSKIQLLQWRHRMPLEAQIFVGRAMHRETVASVLGDNELLGILRSGRVDLTRSASATQVEEQLRTPPELVDPQKQKRKRSDELPSVQSFDSTASSLASAVLEGLPKDETAENTSSYAEERELPSYTEFTMAPKLNAMTGRIETKPPEETEKLDKHVPVEDLNEKLTRAKEQRKSQRLSKTDIKQLKQKQQQRREQKQQRQRERL